MYKPQIDVSLILTQLPLDTENRLGILKDTPVWQRFRQVDFDRAFEERSSFLRSGNKRPAPRVMGTFSIDPTFSSSNLNLPDDPSAMFLI